MKVSSGTKATGRIRDPQSAIRSWALSRLARDRRLFRRHGSSLLVLALFAVLAFAHVRAATVSAFTPTFGPAGTQVSLFGSGFLGTTNVQLGDLFADFTVLANDQMLVIVPPLPVTGPWRIGAPSGGTVTAGSFLAPPRIGGFTPERSGTNTTVTIDGANFTGAIQVQFAGTNATFQVTAATQISAKVPAGASSGPIRVVTPAGAAASASDFTVSSPAPIVDDLIPAVGAPGSAVRIEGANFSGATQVAFNGVPAAFAVTAETQISAAVPAAATTGPVAVISPKGTGTSATPYTVTKGPVVLSFSPEIGSPGTTVRILGINFTSVTGVSFNGVPVSGISSPAVGQLEVAVPNNATTGLIRVTNTFGVGASALSFVVTKAPIFDESLFPLDPAAPGTVVVFNGMNFTGATGVRFNGTAAAFAVTASTQLHATVPNGATTGPVSIANPFGSTTSSIPFTVIGSPPFVTGFVPPRGVRGDTIIIYGYNFTNVTAVTFNGTNAPRYAATAPTQIHAVVPAGITTGPIKVTTTAGSFTTTNLFYGPPRLAGFSPERAAVGETVTVTGTNLSTSFSLDVGGVAWPFAVGDANILSAIVPPNAVDGFLTVSTPGGAFITTNRFHLLPRILNVSPLIGPPGTAVAIEGTGLSDATAVLFGGAAAAFQVVSSSEIHAEVPLLARTGTLEVQTPAGSASSEQVFTVTGASDLSLAMTTTPAIASPGSLIAFQLVVLNRGPALVSDLRLTNALPTGLIFNSGSSSRGELATEGPVSSLRLPTFEAGASLIVNIIALAPAEGRYTNHALVLAAEADPNTPNNTADGVVAILTDAARVLRIQALGQGSQVVVSWPTSAVPFVLQSSTNIALPGAWNLAPGTPQVTSGRWRLTNSNAGDARFYRLRQNP